VPAAVQGLLATLLLLPSATTPATLSARRLLLALLGHPRRRVRDRATTGLRDCACDASLVPLSHKLVKPDAEAVWAVVVRFGFGGSSSSSPSSSAPAAAAAAAAALLALLPRSPTTVAFKWYAWIECHAPHEPSCATLLCAMQQQQQPLGEGQPRAQPLPLLTTLLPALFSLEAPVRRAAARRLNLFDLDDSNEDPFAGLLIDPFEWPDAATAARRRAQDGEGQAGDAGAAPPPPPPPPPLARAVALLGGDPALCPPAAAAAAFGAEEVAELGRVMLNRALPPGVRAEAGEQLAPLAAAAPALRAAALGDGGGGGIGAFVAGLEEDDDLKGSLGLKIAALDLLFVFAARGAFGEGGAAAASAVAAAAAALALARQHQAARASAARLLACLAFSAASGAWAGYYPGALMGLERQEHEEEDVDSGPNSRLPPIFAEGDVVARLPLPLASSHAFPFPAEAVEVVASAAEEAKAEEQEAALSELVQQRRLLSAAAASASSPAPPSALARAIEASASALRAEAGASAEVVKATVEALRSCPEAARERLALNAVRAAAGAASHAAFVAATGALRFAAASREGSVAVRELLDEEDDEEEDAPSSSAPAWARALTKRVLGPAAPETAEDRGLWRRALPLAGRLLLWPEGDSSSPAASAAQLLLGRLAPAAAEWLSRDPFEDVSTTRELLALLRRALAGVGGASSASPLAPLLRSLAESFLPSPSVDPFTRAMALDVVAEAALAFSSAEQLPPLLLCACIAPVIESALVPALGGDEDGGGGGGGTDPTNPTALLVAAALRTLLAITSKPAKTWASAWTSLDPPGSPTATSTFWLRRLFCGVGGRFRAPAAALAARLAGASSSPRARLLLLRGWPDVHACMMEVASGDAEEEEEVRAAAMEFLLAAAAVEGGGEAEDDEGADSSKNEPSSCFGLGPLLSAPHDLWARHLPRALERGVMAGSKGAAATAAAAAAAALALAAASADPHGPSISTLLESRGGLGRRSLVRLATSGRGFAWGDDRGWSAAAASAAASAVQTLAAVALASASDGRDGEEEVVATASSSSLIQDAASAAASALVGAAAALEWQGEDEASPPLPLVVAVLARRACDALNALLLLPEGSGSMTAALAAAAAAASDAKSSSKGKEDRPEQEQEQQEAGAAALLSAVAAVLERGGANAVTGAAAALTATLVSGSTIANPAASSRLCRALLGALPADVFEEKEVRLPGGQEEDDGNNSGNNSNNTPALLAALRNLLWASGDAREVAVEAGLGIALADAVSSAAAAALASAAASGVAKKAPPSSSSSSSVPASIAWEAAAAARRARLSALAEAKRSGRAYTAAVAVEESDDAAARERDVGRSLRGGSGSSNAACEPIYSRMRLCLDLMACLGRASDGGGAGEGAGLSSSSPSPWAPAAAAALVEAWDALCCCCCSRSPSHERALLSLLGAATELASEPHHAPLLAPLADRAAAALLPPLLGASSVIGGPAATVASARWALTLNVSNRTRVSPKVDAAKTAKSSSNSSTSSSPAAIAASAAFLRRFATAGAAEEGDEGGHREHHEGEDHCRASPTGAAHLCRAGPRGFLGRALTLLHERGAAAALAAGGGPALSNNAHPPASSSATDKARLAGVCGVLAALAATGPGRRAMLFGGGASSPSSSPSVLGSATQLLLLAALADAGPTAAQASSPATVCALLALLRHLCLSPAAARPHVLAAGPTLVRALAGLLQSSPPPPHHQQAMMAALALRAVLHGGGERAKALLRAVEGPMVEAVAGWRGGDDRAAASEWAARARAALEEVVAAVAA
jgi:hypothetical protein